MGDIWEMLLTSDTSSTLGSACVWDYKTGTSLHCYKNGGILNTNTASFIGDQYFIAAERSKPLVHVWPVDSQEPARNFKSVCSGPVSALAISPDGRYCAGGIGELLHVWQVSNGQLLVVAGKHFQPIVKIQFSSDGVYVVSAGEDGLVLVWVLERLVAAGSVEPLHVLTGHSLPVRDLQVSVAACGARVLTVSADCTLQVHQLSSGQLLLSVVLEAGLTAVTCGATGTPVFVGANDGMVHEVSLLKPPRGLMLHEKQTSFRGHDEPVTALAVSADGLTLASGARDCLVALWHLPSRLRLRTLHLSAPVTTLLFCSALFDRVANSSSPLSPFQRTLSSSSQPLSVFHRKDLPLPFPERASCACDRLQISKPASLQQEIDKVRLINGQLYQFFMDRIVERADCQCNTKTTTVSHPKKKIRLE